MALKTINKRWVLEPADPQKVQSLQQALKIHPALCRLLVLRGITTYEEAKLFFRPSTEHLHDPFLMKGMEQAVARIMKALASGEKILVYGDYDVDGTTAVAVVYSFLKQAAPEAPISFYIPHRYREGYGVSKAGIDFAIENGFTLLITLDCGIKSTELIGFAQKAGTDVIVCDHHTPDEILPPALAVLNPKQRDCNYPYKELSGCGIGFKLITALAQKMGIDEALVHQFLDLVATSIAADIVPIDGENRVLAFYGIKRANENPCPSLRKLKDMSGLQRALDLSDLVFAIGPKINAAGRMDDARKAVELFVETDEDRIAALAEELMMDNTGRKEVDKSITDEALSMLHNDDMVNSRRSTVLYQEHWHKGVVGIVASRLIEHCYKPTIVLTKSNGKITGSARSVSGFNVYEAICRCGHLLENYGGHFYAAGLTLSPEALPQFKETFEAVVAETILPSMFVPDISIDAEIELEDINRKFYDLICAFQPFGPSNMRPVFLTRKLTDYQASSRIVKDQHIKFCVQNSRGTVVDGIGFRLADKMPYVSSGAFDMVYTIDLNEFNGNSRLQVKVLDIRPNI